jgi:hypothetical protein
MQGNWRLLQGRSDAALDPGHKAQDDQKTKIGWSHFLSQFEKIQDAPMLAKQRVMAKFLTGQPWA